MSVPSAPDKARLVIAIMYHDEALLEDAVKILVRKFGSIDLKSEPFDFAFTDYYEEELGKGLRKRFFCFSEPLEIERLPDIKLCTNRLEKKISKGPKRKINIDPGYLTVDALVLASCKPRPYRIYLGKGVYAHLTFIFRKSDVMTFSWTFADYATPGSVAFFMKVREKILTKNI
jgi:hypothetical protein